MTSFLLHCLAMFFMLLDHMWSTLLPSHEWLTIAGRLAYPLFAFMIAEGFRRTSDRKRYMKRMLIFALISEIPFDMVYSGIAIYPFHQNVMWTFLISLGIMEAMERLRTKKTGAVMALGCAGFTLLGFLLGMITMADYYGAGVLTVLVFYFLRGDKWWHYPLQFLCMWYLHWNVLGGQYYPVELFGMELEIMKQGVALLALIPIWLYRGRQGYHSKWFQYFCYSFYPVHLLVLYLIGRIL